MKADGQAMNSFIDVVRGHAAIHPDRTVFTFLADGESREINLSFGEIDRQARRIAAALQDRTAPGERVVLLLEPEQEFMASFLGCLYAGVIAVPAAPASAGAAAVRRLKVILRDTSACLVLASAQTKSYFDSHIGDLQIFNPLTWLDTCPLSSGSENDWQPPAIGPDTIAFLQYTSGSTTDPRGTMVSHGNLLYETAAVQKALGQNEDTVMVNWFPLHQDGGLIFLALQALYNGSRCVFMSPASFVGQPLAWLRLITRYRACYSAGSNFAYELCVRRFTPEECADLDLRSWRIAGIGTEPVRAQTLQRFTRAFAPYGFDARAFVPGYGLAEATLIVSIKTEFATPAILAGGEDGVEPCSLETLDPDAAYGRQLVTCGPLLPGSEAAIVHPDECKCCAPGEIGEIWISSPGVAKGYWNQPKATEQTFKAYLADTGKGPYLRTGDLGCLHEGELFIAGRLKDMIIIRGNNHYPHDIEATVESSHPMLRRGSCATFSVLKEGEESLVVLQEIRAEYLDQIDAGEIFRAMRRAVAEGHGLPVHAMALLPAKSLPKTTSGKLQRFACRAAFLENGLNRLATWEEHEPSRFHDPTLPDDAEDKLRSIWRKVLGNQPIELPDNFFNLGGDSLSALHMTIEVEECFGKTVPADFFQTPTFLNLLQLVRDEPLNLPVPPIVEPVPALQAAHQASKEPLWSLSRKCAAGPLARVRACGEAIAFQLPYAAGLRWLKWWCGNPLAPALFYRNEARLIRRFLAGRGEIKGSEARVCQASLLGNIILNRTRELRLNDFATSHELGQRFARSRERFWRPFQQAAVEARAGSVLPWPYRLTDHAGLEVFREQKRGVILLAMHAHCNSLMGPILPCLGFERTMILGLPSALRAVRERYAAGASLESSGVWAELVKEAFTTLRQSGVVLMDGDGFQGKGRTFHLPVIGRLHPFRSGFAEIALRSGAGIVPMSATLDAEGRICFTFHRALNPGTADLPHDLRVLYLVRQYAAFLEERWENSPQDVQIRHVARHLELPVAVGSPYRRANGGSFSGDYFIV